MFGRQGAQDGGDVWPRTVCAARWVGEGDPPVAMQPQLLGESTQAPTGPPAMPKCAGVPRAVQLSRAT